MKNKKGVFALLVCLASLSAWGEDDLSLTPQEAAIVQAIKAQNASGTLSAAEAPAPDAGTQPVDEDAIQLPESTKQQAFAETPSPLPPEPAEEPLSAISTARQTPEAAPAVPPTKEQAAPSSVTENAKPSAQEPQTPAENAPQASSAQQPLAEPEPEEDLSQYENKCLTVAYVDIDEAFNKHPRTVAVKEQIHLKILAKEQEVESAKQIISALNTENKMLAAQLLQLKPFYERIVVQPQEFEPKIEEKADSLLLGNIINRLLFSGAEVITTSPLNTPEELEDITARISANKKIIAERTFFIDNYKYATREEILKLEEKEVKEILKDIYTEIKSFAKKRNIGAVVRKDEVLYGEKPVNVTKDFINRLKKSKKYRKK